MANTGRKNKNTRSETGKVIEHMNSLRKQESVKGSPSYPPVIE